MYASTYEAVTSYKHGGETEDHVHQMTERVEYWEDVSSEASNLRGAHTRNGREDSGG